MVRVRIEPCIHFGLRSKSDLGALFELRRHFDPRTRIEPGTFRSAMPGASWAHFDLHAKLEPDTFRSAYQDGSGHTRIWALPIPLRAELELLTLNPLHTQIVLRTPAPSARADRASHPLSLCVLISTYGFCLIKQTVSVWKS